MVIGGSKINNLKMEYKKNVEKNAEIKDRRSSTKNIYKKSAKTIVNFCGRPDVGTWACAACIPLRPGPSIFLGYLYANKHIKQTPKMDKFSPQICNSISMEIRYFLQSDEAPHRAL